MDVDLRTIESAIASGARTVANLQDMTRACLGCGTCRIDLMAILERAAATNGKAKVTERQRPEAP